MLMSSILDAENCSQGVVPQQEVDFLKATAKTMGIPYKGNFKSCAEQGYTVPSFTAELTAPLLAGPKTYQQNSQIWTKPGAGAIHLSTILDGKCLQFNMPLVDYQHFLGQTHGTEKSLL